MAVKKALFIHGAAGVPNYGAEEDRISLVAALGGRNYEAISPGVGFVGAGHGVLSFPDLAVTANGTPNNHVFVAPGSAAVRGSQNNSQGVYVCALDAAFDITVPAAHATLDRKDLIVAQVRDGAFAAFSQNDWTPAIVTGTPAASPVDPAVPEDCLVLARLLVRDTTEAGGTIVRAQDITDLRVQCRANGATIPVADAASWPNPRPYERIFDIATQQEKMRNAANTGWIVLSNVGPGINYTPTLYNWSVGAGFNKARYYRIGRLNIVNGFASMGSGATTNSNPMGVGLPPGISAANLAAEFGGQLYFHGAARAFDVPGGGAYAAVGLILSGSDPGSGVARDRITLFATAGTAAWANTTPFTWDGSTGDGFSWFAVWESANAEG